jgi:hypothetical protein
VASSSGGGGEETLFVDWLNAERERLQFTGKDVTLQRAQSISYREKNFVLLICLFSRWGS